jgi:hypothetical protein
MRYTTKTLILAVVVLAFSLDTFAKKESAPTRHDRLGITSSFGNPDVVNFENLVGGASYSGNGNFNLGVIYLHPLNRFLDLESGIEYGSYKIIVRPMLYPGLGSYAYGKQFSMITVPLSLRVNFLRYLFISGGLLLSSDFTTSMPIDSQTGLGATVGAGLQYTFKERFTLFVNPYSKAHSLVSFSGRSQYQQHLFESGFRVGLTLTIK